jgi:hypothetical protein
MCDYEVQRLARIEENKRRLAELVPQAVAPLGAAPAAAPKPRAKPRVEPREPRRSGRKVTPAVYDFGEDASERGGVGRGRYGVEGAESCHSCRQKTDSYKAYCTTCPNKWCAACLRTRYGEDVFTANEEGGWRCGRCRGNCLCSNCRRRNGLAPTGQMGPLAAAAGFESVEAFLERNSS